MTKIVVGLITAPKAEAAALARSLVEERLVACVNILPAHRSIYRWQGKICDEEEVLLILKTAADRCSAVISRVKELHSYDVPEVIFLPITSGLDAYLSWVTSETR